MEDPTTNYSSMIMMVTWKIVANYINILFLFLKFAFFFDFIDILCSLFFSFFITLFK